MRQVLTLKQWYHRKVVSFPAHVGQDTDTHQTATYSAFCRRYGCYSTPAAGGYHNWNEEAMAVMTADLQDPWDGLYQSVLDMGDEVTSAVAQPMEWAVNHLGTIPIFRDIECLKLT